jgi:hypothetical protein
MLIPTAFIADKSKKKKVTPVSKEEQAKAFDILKRQTEKEKASEQKFIQDQLIAQDEAIQRQRAGLNTPKPKPYTEITVPTPATPVAPTVKTTPEGLVKKTFNTKYGVVDYVADERESKIFKGTDVNAINNLTKDIVQYFEGLGRDQGRKPIVKNTREKYTFDEVNAALNPNFVEEETRKGVKQFEDATLGKLDVLGVRARLNELADYAKQSDSTLGQVAGGFVEAVANPMTTFAMSTGNIIDPNATLEERGGAVANLALAAIPVGQFAGAATAGASAFKQGLSSGLRNAIKVGAREYAKDTLFGNLALREITLDSVVRQLRDAGEVEGNVLRFKNDLRREAKRSGVNPSDYLKNKFQEAEVAVEPSIPSPTQVIQEAEQPVVATANPVIDEALRTADEITGQAPTTGNSAIDEAFKVEQEIAEQATPKLIDEPIVKTEPVTSPTEITESDLEKLFQETIAPTLIPAKATKTTKTRKVETEVTEPAPVINQESNAIVNEVSSQPESVAVQEPIATPETVVSKPITNTTPEELANPNVSVTQVPFKLDWTSKESAKRSMDYLNSLRNKFKESGESGIENIDDLPLLSVSYLHQWHINNFKSSPINNKTLLPKSVYQKSIEELTYGEFKNMNWRLVPDTKENQPLISLLKQREKAFNRMITYIKENPKGGVGNAWDNYRQILASRNNVVNPNDTELMDALWQAFKTDAVIDANVELNRLFGTWYDPKENKLFPPSKRTGSRSPNREAVEQFVDAQEEALQRLAKESKNKSLGNNRQRGAYVPPTKAELEFVARSVAYVIGKTGLKLDDALIETSKYLKQKFNFDVTFNSEYIEDIKKELEKINIPTGVAPTSQAIKVPVSSAMQAEQPPVPPTQTATTAIPEPPQEQFTSAKNRMTQEVRDEYDMGKFDEPTRRAWEESLTNAKQELQSNNNAVDNVIAKVESKQAINETEQSVLVVALSRERQNARRLLEQTDNATTPEEIATLAEQTKIAEDRIDNYTNALNRAGSETARTLNARRAIIDSAEDLVSIRAKARQTYGKTLEAADEEAINEIGKGLEDINAQIDDATGKGTTPIETVKANTRVKGIKKSAPKLQPKADAKRKKQFEAIVNRVKEKLDGFVRPSTIETMGVPTKVDLWQPRINDPASQAYFKQLASVQNDMGKVIQKLVTDEAIEDFDTLLTRLQADGFNITDTDLKLILSADYPNTKLYDFSDIEKEYVKMVRRQLAQEAKGSSVAERGRLIRKVQNLSQKVQAGVRKTTDKTVKTIFEENIDLQNRLDDLQAQYEGYNDKLDKASQQERAVIQRQIDKIKEQITNPVLVDRIKREVPQNVQDLVHERELLRGELNDKLRELADKKFKEDHPYLNALQMAAQVPTELLVSLDNSAALTHGAFMVIRNPLKWTKATSKSFAALISEGKAKDILATVRTRDSYDDMVRAGVAGIKQRDLQDANAYASTLQKVPYVGSLFKRSNQAMEVFGAVIRADYFDALAKPHRMEYLRGKITQSELMDRYKLIAEQVNTVTGKGIKELPKPVSVIAPFANFGISRVKTATMTPVFNAIAKGDKVMAKQFAKEYFKYAASTMGLLKVAQMNGLEVGIDPSDPEYFGKIKLPGIDKWWDISGGVLEPYRILINSKPVRNVTGAEESKFKTVADFAQSKLGSIPKTGMNVALGLTGETSYGRNYDVRTDEGRLNVLLDNLPINVKIGKEAVESDKSIGAKVAESSLQFIGGRLTKEKKQKVGRPDE